MLYHSTRQPLPLLSSQEALLQGLSHDGGLFVCDGLDALCIDVEKAHDYMTLAKGVLSPFLRDFSPEAISACLHRAYDGKFASPDPKTITPLTRIGNEYLLELYHGPTSAFKDVALCLLPQLMSEALKAKNDRLMIATATSGDTGKAALSGFCDVDRIGIAVFYPHGKVSDIQRLQMVTQPGHNVTVRAVEGNFDDVQSALKRAFKRQSEKGDVVQGVTLTSANSINIGRLLPQIVYYFDAWRQLKEKGTLGAGGVFDVTVPTGNFGNVLAGYLAMRLGCPIRHFVVASNTNNVLTDFLTTGVYDRRRHFRTTVTPSMDILISSNLERLLYWETQGDTDFVKRVMHKLEDEGFYAIDKAFLNRLQARFKAGWCSDSVTMQTLKDAWQKDTRFIDPHTAVGLKVARDHATEGVPMVVLSTASPYKFTPVLYRALVGEPDAKMDEFSMMRALESLTQEKAPLALRDLETAPVRHEGVLQPEAIPDYLHEVTPRLSGLL